MRPITPMNLALSMERAPDVGARSHLAEQLRRAILDEAFPPGEPLPSTRTLASELGVARGTVVAAYEDLAGEGYVHTIPGGGTFAAALQPGIDRGRTGPPGPSSSVAPASAAGSRTDPDVLDLRPGQPSTRRIVHRDWSAAWRSAANAPLPTGTPPDAGVERLREGIARHLLRSRGLRCAASDVVVTAGTSDALALVVLGLSATQRPPVRIACEDPGHPAARRVITRLGGHVVPIPVSDGGLDIAELDRVADRTTAVLVTPGHQYPLGGRLDIARRLELLGWSSRAGSFIIEDDYDSEFRHGGTALPSIASLDDSARVVHIGSFSKVLSPWVRCGYIVTRNAQLRAALVEARADLGTPVSGILQSAIADFIEDGGLRRHIARTRREYDHKQKMIARGFAAQSPSVEVSGLDGGLHAVLSWSGGPFASGVVAALAQRRVRVSDLADYYVSAEPARRGIVFGYGACSDLELSCAIETIGAVLSARLSRGPIPRATRVP